MKVKTIWNVLMLVLGVFMMLQIGGMVWGAFTDTSTGWFIRQVLSGADDDVFYTPDLLVGYKFSIPPVAVKIAGHLLFDAAVPAVVLMYIVRIAMRKDGIAPIDFLLGAFDIVLKTTVLFLVAMWFCYDVNTARPTGVFLFILENFIAILMVATGIGGVRSEVARLQKDFLTIKEKNYENL